MRLGNVPYITLCEDGSKINIIISSVHCIQHKGGADPILYPRTSVARTHARSAPTPWWAEYRRWSCIWRGCVHHDDIILASCETTSKTYVCVQDTGWLCTVAFTVYIYIVRAQWIINLLLSTRPTCIYNLIWNIIYTYIHTVTPFPRWPSMYVYMYIIIYYGARRENWVLIPRGESLWCVHYYKYHRPTRDIIESP